MKVEISVLDQVRGHIGSLRQRGAIGFVREIPSFPNTTRVFQRVNFLVAPSNPIDPEDVNQLQSFRASLMLKRSPSHPSSFFTMSGSEFLRFGRVDYEERIPGSKELLLSERIRIDDSSLRSQAIDSGIEVDGPQAIIDLKGPIRIVTIRPLPHEQLAKVIADYEEGYLAGTAVPDASFLILRGGMYDWQIRNMREGKFPVLQAEGGDWEGSKLTASERARGLEVVHNQDTVSQLIHQFRMGIS